MGCYGCIDRRAHAAKVYGLEPLSRSPSPSSPLYSTAGLDFVFHMFFLLKYSKSLEEGGCRWPVVVLCKPRWGHTALELGAE